MKVTLFSLAILSSLFCFSSFADVSKGQQSAINLKKIQKQLQMNREETFKADVSHEKINANLCDADEFRFSKIDRSLLDDFRTSLSKREFKKLSKLFSSKPIFPIYSKPVLKDIQNYGSVELSNQVFNLSAMTQRGVSEQLLSRFKNIKEIVFLDLHTESYHALNKKRDLSKEEFERVELFTNFDIRMRDSKNQKVQFRERVKLIVVKEKNGYKIESFVPVKSEKLIASSSSFSTDTAVSGIKASVPTYLRTEAIRRGGYALAIDDYNKDGQLDMYVGAAGAASLLKGMKNNKFEKVDNKSLGLEDHVLVKSAAFGDFFNTGNKDLLVVTFTPGKENVTNSTDIVLYRNNKGKFKKTANLFDHRFSSRYAMPTAIGDFNGDSFLDFYIGFPGAKDFTTLKEREISSKKYQVQGLYVNNGKNGFKDHSKKALKEASFASDIYPHSAVAVDYDKDGDIDLVVADDRGNVSPIFENLGNGEFQQSNKKIGVINEDYAMGMAIGDLNNDGFEDLAISSVNFHASKRVNVSCEMNWNEAKRHTLGTNGLRIFYGSKSGKYLEMVSQLDVGQGVGGVEFVDYNNDGLLDIYVANGLWSGTSAEAKYDLSSTFVTASATEIFEDELNFKGKPFKSNGFKDDHSFLKFRDKSQSSIMDILSNYKGELSKASGKLKGHRPSLAGFERNRLFRNNGNGGFVEVGYLEGVDSIADGYILGYGDFDKSGQMDIVLRNADPGSKDVDFPTLEFFKNKNKEGKSVTISLKSDYSNKDAIGARVVAKVQNKKIYRNIIANNGTSQSEKLIHIGLGNSSQVEELEIIWPSGKTELRKNIKPGHYVIEETRKTLTSK